MRRFAAFHFYMDWKKPIRFTISGEKWEIPLNILILLIMITVLLMIFGAWMGFSFGGGKI
ncbi:hypothetical protein AAGF08_00205 [Algoriphagus sp. SE2]|uniref:hypothetical protein n=1 Tax=Algoriphagus sp. SE2 TaxID=3141536 RepID=UPI0031CD7242